ncbi:hypothetical protein THRCLA_07558 [Thraustotheca clavata]|uniref:Uncharacterized protein n=1 Tax=Thraustotheca clavata TaxID=74557 RepID=A0A1V9ZCS8_9STRA|nr:hypothetical protein THRCLA_07558 [Thraustotheca clavata]
MVASSMNSSSPTPERTTRKRSFDGACSPSSMDEVPCKKTKMIDEINKCPLQEKDTNVPSECSEACLQRDSRRDNPVSVGDDTGELTDKENNTSPLSKYDQCPSPKEEKYASSPRPDDYYYNDSYEGYYDYGDESDRGRRTLKLEYWTRSEECKERKWDHLDKLDSEEHGMTREEHIYATTLAGRMSYMEPNMFPYETPEGIEHWTLWSRNDLRHADVQEYVERWISTNAPHVSAWNYDDNPERSIDIFHVHVYLQVGASGDVLQGRNVADFVH